VRAGFVAWAAIVLAGCGADPPTGATARAAGNRLRVVATTGMVAELARAVGGPHVEVFALMGEGVDPHLYKTAPGDIARLLTADLVLISGQHLEGKMAYVLTRLGQKRPVVAVTAGIDESKILQVQGGVHDPHLWFDVALWSEAIPAVRDALAAIDPAHTETYRANAEAYKRELLALDAWCRERLATIPAAHRVLVTAHDAFGYFGRAYDVEVRAVQGLSTEAEAGVSEVNALVDFLVRRKIGAVFIESSLSDRNVRALVEGCRARGHAIVVGGQLYSDALGPAGTPEGTYTGMVRHNVETIAGALQ